MTVLKCTVLGDNIVGRPQGQRSKQHPLTGESLEPGAEDKHSDANTEISSVCQMLVMASAPASSAWRSGMVIALSPPLLGAYRSGQRKETPNDPPSHTPPNGAVAIDVAVEGMP
jgi:hypothetical protein